MSDAYSGNGDRRVGGDPRQPPATAAPSERRTRFQRLLRPGIGIKRWLVVVFIGELLLALGGAILLRSLFRDVGSASGGGSSTIVDIITLAFLPPELRLLLLFAVGAGLFGYGAWRLLRVVIEPFQVHDEPLVEMLYQRRLRARGPNIVTIGGGTGLSMLLRGLKELTSNITAVVTVADDGGSSGKLRSELGLPPMGDIRNCIEALADVEPAMTRLLHYRFLPSTPSLGQGATTEDTTPFGGHAFGNLLIAALTDITGDFEEAVRQSNRVLAVRGSVVPVAGQPITLHAELEDGSVVEGQSHIARARGIRRVWISPDGIKPAREALEAIANADVVVIGPGSLFTSLLPPLLVPGIKEALAQTHAPRLFVCNVATQVGETEGYMLSQHLSALTAHGLGDVIDCVLVNSNVHARAPQNYPAAPVRVDISISDSSGPVIFTRDLVDDQNAHRHDARKLAQTIIDLYDERVIHQRAVLSA